MKRKLLLAALLVAGALGMRAQTDVTDTYLVNPSFELGTDGTAAASGKGNFTPYGWTLTESSATYRSSEINSSSSETSSTFGSAVTPADGDYYFFGRHSWNSALQMTLSQTASQLPAGIYSLDVGYKIATKLTGTNGTLKLKAIQNETELNTFTSPIGFVTTSTTYFNTAGWTRLSVPFTVSTTGDVTLQLYMDFNPGEANTPQEAIIIDDVRLYSLSEASATDPADVTGFLVNQSFELGTYTGTLDASSTASEGSRNYPTGWTFMLKTSGWNNCVNVTDAPSHGMYARETWAATINEVQVYQSLTGLPKGVYEISAVARTNDAGANDICTYGKVGETTSYSSAWDQSKMNATWNGAENWQTLSSIFAVGDEGTAEVGLHSTHFMQFDNFTFKYYGDVTVAEVKLVAYVAAYTTAMTEAGAFTEESMFDAAWDDLQDAISNNTLDLNDPALTEDDLTTATANLVAANTAATAAVEQKTKYDTAVTTIGSSTNVDLTSLIGNPSFESTAAYALVGDGWINEGVGIQGQNNSGFDGYRVGSVFAERWVASGSIGAFKTSQKLTLPAGIYSISVVGSFNGTGASLFVDGESTAITDAKTYSMSIAVSDKQQIEFGLQAVSPTGTWFKADNFTLTYLASSWATLPYTLATGKMGTDKAEAQKDAETAFTSSPSKSTYNALLAAIANAEASVANYTALKAAIDKAQAEKEANNFVTEAAITTFEGVISTAETAWNDVTYTDQQAKDAVGTLKTAACNYMGSAWITPDPKPEVWWYFNTWSTEGDTDGTDFFNPFFENFKNATENLPANTFTASLSGLENGRYEVEVWARVQRRSDADFNANNSMITMNVNGGNAVSLMSGQTTVGSGTSVMRLGRYTAIGDVTDGTLTLSIDVTLGSNVHWLSWRDVKYTKLDEADMTISDEAEYGTFCAPFAVTIPDDVTVNKVTGVEGNTLTLEEVTTTIPANTPVVVNKAGGLETTKFYGKAEDGTLTVGLLTGTLTRIAAPNGSYILQKQGDKVGFYQVNTEVAKPNIPANRAYIAAEESFAKAFFFPGDGDDEATLIEGLDALTAGEYEGIYTLGGVKVDALQKGTNIVQLKSGKTLKINVK